MKQLTTPFHPVSKALNLAMAAFAQICVNRISRHLNLLVAASCLCAVFVCTQSSTVAEQPSAVSAAMQSVFSPERAPSKKSMGLLQRSFLDLVESSKLKLEVALVIDGTDSMADDIETVRQSLQQMTDDLRRYRGSDVSFAMVVYRDVGAASGEVAMPLGRFSSDPKVLAEAIAALKTETGAPYFPEAVDLGVHSALAKLNWSADEQTSRWLILVGDAPPYDPDFQDTEKQTGAKRHYDTDLLLDLAERKSIQINSILCNSRPDLQPTYDRVIDKTRGFMSTLCTKTGGVMLDLSYADIRSAIVSAAKIPRSQQQTIDRISAREIEAARNQANQAEANFSTDRRLKIAVLPHMPMDEINYSPSRKEVQVAAELRLKFEQLPTVDIVNPSLVLRRLRFLRTRKLSDSQLLQALALQLKVDYVVWGKVAASNNLVELQSAIYQSGSPIVQAAATNSAAVAQNVLVGTVMDQLAKGQFDSPEQNQTLSATLASYRSNQRQQQSWLRPVAASYQVQGDLMAGLEALQHALGYMASDQEGARFLSDAEQRLRKAVADEIRNPLSHFLLASCLFNQAQRATLAGDSEAAKSLANSYISSLKQAYRHRTSTSLLTLRQEIEADYALLVTKDWPSAVKLYQGLTKSSDDNNLESAKRAHWMLAGIHSGDWGVGSELVSSDIARQHIIQILAHWPDSSEAGLLKRQLRFDERSQQTEFPHVPRQNMLILTGLSASD